MFNSKSLFPAAAGQVTAWIYIRFYIKTLKIETMRADFVGHQIKVKSYRRQKAPKGVWVSFGCSGRFLHSS